MAIEIVSFPIKHGGSFHSCMGLPRSIELIGRMTYRFFDLHVMAGGCFCIFPEPRRKFGSCSVRARAQQSLHGLAVTSQIEMPMRYVGYMYIYCMIKHILCYINVNIHIWFYIYIYMQEYNIHILYVYIYIYKYYHI